MKLSFCTQAEAYRVGRTWRPRSLFLVLLLIFWKGDYILKCLCYQPYIVAKIILHVLLYYSNLLTYLL